ncbi:MAG: helix-turn-helix domain-containing protein [Endomicrobium sp.]|jgi:predicted DNA-binding transcriptional regulator AlpA|nr:helix-turn-helix domain-containing protein [Endomicrobium sp.]
MKIIYQINPEQLKTISKRVAEIISAHLCDVRTNKALKVKDIRDIIGRSSTSISKYVRKIDFPHATRIGRVFKFDAREVEQWLENLQPWDARRRFQNHINKIINNRRKEWEKEQAQEQFN